MIKPLPQLQAAVLLPPVAPEHYPYFENGADHPFGDFSPTLCNAWWLADCALAAYAGPGMAAGMFESGELALAGTNPISGPRYGGFCYVVADERKIIVAFRGTQVVKKLRITQLNQEHGRMRTVLRDVLTDAKIRLVPWAGRSGGRVHQGFSDALSELLPDLTRRIDSLRREIPERRLWLTGHSLGAALATLAADRLEAVQGIHTFGSPQVGDATFAGNFATPGWRFRNHSDAVPWVPSAITGYRHVNHGRYFDRHRKLRDEPGNIGLLKDAMEGLPDNVARSLRALSRGQTAGLAPECINDHSPLCYAIHTWNAYVASISG